MKSNSPNVPGPFRHVVRSTDQQCLAEWTGPVKGRLARRGKHYHDGRYLVAPDINQLRDHGWTILSCNGPYCLVWGHDKEVLMRWQDGGWYQVYVVSGGSRRAS